MKKLGFTKNEIALGLSVFILIEIFSLWRFHDISKAQVVVGTEEGFWGFTKDVSDSQWNYFEDNLYLLISFQVINLLGSAIVKVTSNKSRYLNLRIYNILMGIGFSVFLHSVGVIFSLAVSILFYLLQKYLRNFRYFSWLIWTLVIGVLYCNETYDGYRFATINSSLGFLDDFRKENQILRWNVIYNLILLRILSFTFDHKWAQENRQTKYSIIDPRTTYDEQIDVRSYKDIVKDHQQLPDYNFISFLAYLYYVPLLFAGPTVTFNAYNSQLRVPQQTYTNGQVIKYVLRVYLLDFGTFQLFLHICYPNAIAKNKNNFWIWHSFNSFDLHFMSFFNLVFIWYKFLTIWRITRAWALMDGIETPENMNRCIYNNYNFSGFWRSWHRSFNQWLIRYIYVPLGGNKLKVLNMWVVFTFVALWHDFKLDLLLWAWIICLALIPEIAVQSYFNKDKFYKKWWFKYLCAFGGAFQIEMMCLANLIGFGNGHEGMGIVIKNWLSIQGLICLLFYICIRNYAGCVYQLSLRENETDKNY